MRDVRKHVLCVDSDWDACEACQAVTIANPYINFTFAYDRTRALAFIRRGIFDLYVVESWLSDGSGIDLCRTIRVTDANTPVVVLVSEAHAGDHVLAMMAGASAYLDRPAGLFHLESTVRALLRQSDARALVAKRAEVDAMRDSIAECLSGIDARTNGNAERKIRANEHLLRANAYSAFIGSGGIKAHFERLWPGMLGDMTTDWMAGCAIASKVDAAGA